MRAVSILPTCLTLTSLLVKVATTFIHPIIVPFHLELVTMVLLVDLLISTAFQDFHDLAGVSISLSKGKDIHGHI